MNYSNRAKYGLTKQLRTQLKFLQDNLSEKQKTIKKIRMYARYKLPGYGSMLKAEQNGIAKTKKDIANLKTRIKRRQSEGKIYKII